MLRVETKITLSGLKPKRLINQNVSLLALCGIKCIDLTLKTKNILGVHVPNKNLEHKQDFYRHFQNVE